MGLFKSFTSVMLFLLQYVLNNGLGYYIFTILQQKRIVPALVTYVVDLLFGEIIKKKPPTPLSDFPPSSYKFIKPLE